MHANVGGLGSGAQHSSSASLVVISCGVSSSFFPSKGADRGLTMPYSDNVPRPMASPHRAEDGEAAAGLPRWKLIAYDPDEHGHDMEREGVSLVIDRNHKASAWTR